MQKKFTKNHIFVVFSISANKNNIYIFTHTYGLISDICPIFCHCYTSF